MTASFLFIVLIGFVICVAVAVILVITRRGLVDAASGAALAPDQRSPLWALVLIATVPLAGFITMIGGGILSVLVGRCTLWGCSPSRPVSQLDFSLPTIGISLGLCAVIFAVWWLALLPSPLPRNPTLRRTIGLAVPSIAALFAAVYAVFEIG